MHRCMIEVFLVVQCRGRRFSPSLGNEEPTCHGATKLVPCALQQSARAARTHRRVTRPQAQWPVSIWGDAQHHQSSGKCSQNHGEVVVHIH